MLIAGTQTPAQEARAIQSFEDHALARYLEAQEEDEGRECGNCALGTNLDRLDANTVVHLLPLYAVKPYLRKAVERAVRSCVWCAEKECLMGAAYEACPKWMGVEDCEVCPNE